MWRPLASCVFVVRMSSNFQIWLLFPTYARSFVVFSPLANSLSLSLSLSLSDGRGAYLKTSVGPHLYRGPEKGYGIMSLFKNTGKRSELDRGLFHAASCPIHLIFVSLMPVVRPRSRFRDSEERRTPSFGKKCCKRRHLEANLMCSASIADHGPPSAAWTRGTCPSNSGTWGVPPPPPPPPPPPLRDPWIALSSSWSSTRTPTPLP